MKIFLILSFITLWSLDLSTCNSPKSKSIQNEKSDYRFLAKEEAQKEILDDDTEFFFDKLSTLEMEIQMRDSTKLSRDERLNQFLKFLPKEVMEWSIDEKQWMQVAMDSALNHVNYLNKNLITEEIQLIKINTNHYGPSVFYTRENIILIPKNVLRANNFNQLYSVMLHEIAHIISRSNPALKKAMYAEIGFVPIGKKITYPEPLKNRILINPDGINDDYMIRLNHEGKSVSAVPAIVSNFTSYRPSVSSFFSYIKFDLYLLEGNKVIADENGFSTLDKNMMTSFFNQIKDNTQYIIHPDEIIADNFMLLIKARQSKDYSQFTTEGKNLILNLQGILENH